MVLKAFAFCFKMIEAPNDSSDLIGLDLFYIEIGGIAISDGLFMWS